MRAVALVGGLGTRLRPLTLATPKQMLPVGDRPMIEWVVGRLAAHGVDEVVLSLGYRPDAFARAYPDGECAGVRLVYAVEPEPLDTAGAIAFAAREAGVDKRFLVLNGDVLTDLDIGELVAFHDRTGARATISLTPVEDPSAFGVVPTDEAGRVTAFIEKPSRHEAPTNLINAGTYVLEPEVLERIPAGCRVNVEREVFPGLADEGVLYAMASDTYWLDTGTPELYLRANLDVLDGRRGDAPVAAIVGDGATVDATATVTHAIVGAGCTVAADARVVDSVLLPGVQVGEGARIEGSIVGAGAGIGAGAVISGCSVVGDDVEIDAGGQLDGARVPAPEGTA